MAFDITRFQKKYKEAVAENHTLKARIAGWAADKAGAIESAVLAAVTPLRNEITRLKASLVDSNQRLTAADVVRANLEAKVDELASTVNELDAFIRKLEQVNIELARKANAAQPAVDAAEQRTQDALALLKKHEDRMNEKERRELAAMENRKVLAAAVPDRNRG